MSENDRYGVWWWAISTIPGASYLRGVVQCWRCQSSLSAKYKSSTCNQLHSDHLKLWIPHKETVPLSTRSTTPCSHDFNLWCFCKNPAVASGFQQKLAHSKQWIHWKQQWMQQKVVKRGPITWWSYFPYRVVSLSSSFKHLCNTSVQFVFSCWAEHFLSFHVSLEMVRFISAFLHPCFGSSLKFIPFPNLQFTGQNLPCLRVSPPPLPCLF